jgi:hypothetical protein
MFMVLLLLLLMLVGAGTLPLGRVEPAWSSGAPLFNNVRTITVRCGHLGLDGQLVTQLQQGVVHGHLAVPLATLDNEIYHTIMMLHMGSKYLFR